MPWANGNYTMPVLNCFIFLLFYQVVLITNKDHESYW